MESIIVCPQRDKPPCYGCARAEKRAGCHGHCEPFLKWKQDCERNRKAEREYKAKPFSRII